MVGKWNFPAVAGGQINSINNAGIETFRGNELNSLGREIPQNTVDAQDDETKPVIVEFKSFHLETKNFPDYKEFLKVFDYCESTWKGNNDKCEKFIQQAKDILAQPTIPVLRISDFNTKGLEGAGSKRLGTPWSSLIREAGSSNKGDSSGGSFGIGKAAPAANSKLRTLFYDSIDIHGISSHIGVANIMSFEKDEKITTGVGYFAGDESSSAIAGLLSLDPSFVRSEPGTDIYISAFNTNEPWEKRLLHSILMNFFITIHQKKLVVRIENVEINHENLGKLIMGLEDTKDFSALKAYYQLLVSEDTLVVPSPERKYGGIGKFEEGEATLLLTTGNDLNRRVLMTRKTGMRLFERGSISGSISFTGILIITGKNMNQVFKELENPAHTKWEPNRYEDNPKAAEKAMKDLFKFVRDTVHKKFQTEETDTMDAIGLSDFLPGEIASGQGQEQKESLTIKIKEVKQKPKKKVKTKPSTNKQDDVEGLLVDTGIGDEDNPNPRPNTGPNPNPKPKPKPNPKPNPGGGEQKGKKEKNIPIRTTMRYLCTDKSKGIYHVNLSPDKKFTKGKLEFRITGEQTEVKLPIISLSSSQIEDISIENNDVRFINKVGKKDISLEIEIDYDDYCAIEVNLYEI
ncbi:hypothetical protein [Priestia aryabhattai]|uniref:Uncharacterized protein n=1 Tax=Priestia aryabhattai TaxID=412384 RepID=A0ABD7X4F0_PRIAR|nr:hypothetical protein [Priestia aryabhattai]WEA47191.1 hypothetical protein PWO00_27470 [Priestia aryabhattai]